jgi:hypothetical protein
MPGSFAPKENQDVLMVDAESLRPPGTRVSMPLIDAALEQAPSDPIHPINRPSERRE